MFLFIINVHVSPFFFLYEQMLVFYAAQLMVRSVMLSVTTPSHVIKFFHQLYSSSQSDMVQRNDVIIQSTDMAPPDDVIT